MIQKFQKTSASATITVSTIPFFTFSSVVCHFYASYLIITTPEPPLPEPPTFVLHVTSVPYLQKYRHQYLHLLDPPQTVGIQSPTCPSDPEFKLLLISPVPPYRDDLWQLHTPPTASSTAFASVTASLDLVLLVPVFVLFRHPCPVVPCSIYIILYSISAISVGLIIITTSLLLQTTPPRQLHKF